uniref:Copper transport protein n=2 Tax=Parascaris univalens TaxID=6257 RepID=A0A915AUF5_PARUN
MSSHHDHSMADTSTTIANDTVIGNISEAISTLAEPDFLSDINNFLSDLTKSSDEIVNRIVDHSVHRTHMHASHVGHNHALMGHEMTMNDDMITGSAMEQSADMAGHHMMKMWFHGGCNEVVLFEFWRISSLPGLLLSCLVIFVMASLYEGIKWFRVYLQMSVGAPTPQYSQSKRYDVQKGLLEDAPSNGGDLYAPTTTPPLKVNCDSSGVTFLDGASPLAPMRVIQALLYLIQLVLAYWLMLVVMTYNSWLTASVVLGAAFGHWLFAVLKCLNPQADHLDTFATDACH